MDSWETFNRNTLPNKKDFHSKLYLEDITDEVYIHAQKVFEELKLKNLGEYHDLYCLQMYLKIFKINVLKYMNLILLILYLYLAWRACFKKTGVELELLADNDMLMMVQKGVRGGICHAIYRYAKANNNYMRKL